MGENGNFPVGLIKQAPLNGCAADDTHCSAFNGIRIVCVTAEGKAADAYETYVNYLFLQAPKHPQTKPNVGCIWSCGQVVSLANGGLMLFGSALLYLTSLCNLPYLTRAPGKTSLMVTTNELRIRVISTEAWSRRATTSNIPQRFHVEQK